MKLLDVILGRTPKPEPPDYWKPASRVALIWDFDDDGQAHFTVEAPTAEEARAWGNAAERTGKHAEVQAASGRIRSPSPSRKEGWDELNGLSPLEQYNREGR